MTAFVQCNENSFDMAGTADSKPIECTYQGHSFYNTASPLCLALNFIFIKYASRHRRISGFALRQAILLFLDFAVEHNARNPKQLQLDNIADINAEVFRSFEIFLLLKNEKKINASKLKSAIGQITKESEHLPTLMLPMVTLPPQKKTEPLLPDAYSDLVSALTTHTDLLYEKIEFRKKVLSAEPYNFSEEMAKWNPEYNRSNIFEWYQYRIENKIKVSTAIIKDKLKHSTDAVLKQIALSTNALADFRTEFENRPSIYQFSNPTDRFTGASLWNWNPEESRVLKTFLVHGYPFEMTLDTIRQNYMAGPLISQNDCKDIIQLLLFRYNRLGDKKLIKHPVKSWDDLLALYYPDMMDMSCIILFMMLQSNWNKETVLALHEDNFEHALTGALDESQVIIQSEKNRSQGIGKPYYAPKDIVAISTKNDRYSIYNLILLSEDLSRVLKVWEFDSIPFGQENVQYNPLFLCIRYYADWASKGGRHTSASNYKAFTRGVKHFLSRYTVTERKTRLESAQDLTRRLRPTWVMYQKDENNKSSGVLRLQLSHNNASTTDIHYDSSGAATQERRERLRSELEAILGLLRARMFSGLLGSQKQESLESALKIFHIPGMEKPLWGCGNQTRPSWVGAQRHVTPGTKCYMIENCLFCDQVNIFEDSLPYIMERRIHVVELLDDETDRDSEYGSRLDNELEILEFILENWKDPDALKEASRFQRRNFPLLPRDLSFLQVIFEEEDM